MKRIGILTAGGDTPALNASMYGTVVRANQRKMEVDARTGEYVEGVLRAVASLPEATVAKAAQMTRR